MFALIAGSFAALIWAHVASDFSVVNVYENSHSAKPLLYKISGVWGNHEGSVLLWILILAVFGAAVAVFGSNLPLDLRSTVLAFRARSRRPSFFSLSRHRTRFAQPQSACGWIRPQSHPSRSGAGDPSAAALYGLCRLLPRLLLCNRRADLRPCRLCLGALGASLDACCLDIPHHRHSDRLLVGVLRVGVGRLVVLGPGGKRLAHAMAYRHGADPFDHCHGKAG